MKKRILKYVVIFVISLIVFMGYDMIENVKATGNPFIDIEIGNPDQTEQELIEAAETHKTFEGVVVYGLDK